MNNAARLVFVLAFVGMLAGTLLFSRGSDSTLAAPALATPGAATSSTTEPAYCWEVQSIDLLDLFNLVDDLDEMANANAYLTTSVWGPSLQDGADASEADRAAAQATLEQFISCINDRDPMRLLALLSERYQALMVLDLLGGADAMSVIADQIPTVLRSDESTEPIPAPEIIDAWRPTGNPTDIWTVVSVQVPGYDAPEEFFVAFVPGGEGWVIDYIAHYESE